MSRPRPRHGCLAAVVRFLRGSAHGSTPPRPLLFRAVPGGRVPWASGARPQRQPPGVGAGERGRGAAVIDPFDLATLLGADPNTVPQECIPDLIGEHERRKALLLVRLTRATAERSAG